MKILLINPPDEAKQSVLHVPYELAMLAAVTEQEGYDVAILDINAGKVMNAGAWSIDEVRLQLKTDEWDVILIYATIFQYKAVKQLVITCRDICKNAVIILAGPLISCTPKKLMKLLPQLNVGILGEHEPTWNILLQVATNRRFKKVSGIIYRKSPGKILRTKPRPFLSEKELSDLPYPAFKLLPLEEVYFPLSAFPLSPETLTCRRRLDLITERGCNYACKFCGEHDHPLRFQSAEYVVALVKHLRFKYAVDFINFRGKNFTTNTKRCLQICDLWEENDLYDLVRWGCYCQPSTIDEKTLQRMRDTGCNYVIYRAESADDKILQAINRGHTPGQLQAALDATLKTQLTVNMQFTVGHVGENVNSLLTTTKFWKHNQIYCEPHFTVPSPGTKIFEENSDEIFRQHGGLEKYFEALTSGSKHLVVNLTELSDVELLGLRQLMCIQDIERMMAFKNGV